MADDDWMPQVQQTFRSKNDRLYRVERELGRGGFGAVFEVCRLSSSSSRSSSSRTVYAMKVELEKIGHQKSLDMELEVLKSLHQRPVKHFCRVFDTGRTVTYAYMLMTAVGPNLWSLRQEASGRRFSTYTALGVARQCLEAIEELHTAGYIHRDIKPGNFAIGRLESGEPRLVYMLDFGLARRYKHEDGRLRRRRPYVGFRGTVRYASTASHDGRELSRKDDLESWFYALVELKVGHLPWSHVGRGEHDRVQALKLNCRHDVELRQRLTPLAAMDTLLSYIDSLEPVRLPDYDYINRTLAKAQHDGRLIKSPQQEQQLSQPYDWQRRAKPLPPPRPAFLFNEDRVGSPPAPPNGSPK